MHTIVFTGGGTGGHIYPGLAVAAELRTLAKLQKKNVRIYWIGSSSGMDRSLVEKSNGDADSVILDGFYAIPAGKLRRYISFKNVIDVFRIFGGFVAAFFILLKLKPDVLFSKGGFVSVPPCMAARILHIPVYTHECDFTPGLATRINSRSASRILVSYEQTGNFLPQKYRNKIIVTGNPVRSVFYHADPSVGLRFAGIEPDAMTKPVLLILGGSSGAQQINELVTENLDWLCSHFIVVHQTGMYNETVTEKRDNYKPYSFIYSEMPHVIAAADIVLTRAGANSLWECAVLGKPLVLIPLCGSGTRGDQVDNAVYFEKRHAAQVLKGSDATSERLRAVLTLFEKSDVRRTYTDSCRKLVSGRRPATYIAELLYQNISGDNI